MTQQSKKTKTSNGAVILTIALLVIFAFIFMIAFIVSSTSTGDIPAAVTEDTYRAEVDAALENADPAIGEQLIEVQNCTVCHVQGNGTVAPLFTGVANRAGERHEPLDAEQYLYESIVHPGSFVVEEFANAMPNNYTDLLSQQEIGHIIAYLMTLTDEPE